MNNIKAEPKVRAHMKPETPSNVIPLSPRSRERGPFEASKQASESDKNMNEKWPRLSETLKESANERQCQNCGARPHHGAMLWQVMARRFVS